MKTSILTMPIKKIDFKKKPFRTVLILLVISFSLLISINVYDSMKFRNIFDEIYYAGAGATNEYFSKPRSVLGKIPGMARGPELVSKYAEIKDDTITAENYEKDTLIYDLKNLYIKFSTKNKKMAINYGYELSQGVRIQFDNVYYVTKQVLIRKIYIIDDSTPDSYIEENKEIDTYLTNYGITKDKLNQLYEQGMNGVLLKDWLSVYASSYSLDDIGNVTIETEW